MPLILVGATMLSLAACGGADELDAPSDSASQAFVHGEGRNTPLGSTPAGAVVIRPSQTAHLCLAVSGDENKDGAHVVVEPCSVGDASQAWTIAGGEVKIFGDKCLDVISGRDQDGTKLQIWTCAANNINQRWAWKGSNLQWKDHHRCLDLTDGSTVGGTQIQIWKCTDDNINQKWRVAQARRAGNNQSSTPDTVTAAPTPSAGTNTNTGGTDDKSAPQQSLAALTISGANLVDDGGRTVQLKGTNLGGWLVTENWMCGMSDSSDGTGRFARETLEKRFGEAATDKILNLWYDTWLTSEDFDRMKTLGFNVARLPFGWRNLQHADGSWRKDARGNIDFSRLEWAINEAQSRGIYTILDFHIWDSQQANYQRISGTSSQGAADQAKAAAIWTQVAKHFKDSHAVVGYDIINEPTGSAGNKMQDVLYKAVRAEDKTKPIILESVGAPPSSMNWSHVIYSFHEYNMMGNNTSENQKAFDKDDGTLAKWKKWPVPVYIGEFMAQGDSQTLPFMIKGYNQRGYSWTNWTLKTVNMGSWGLYNFHPKQGNIDVLHDSIETITSKIKALGQATEQQPTLNAYKAATNAR